MKRDNWQEIIPEEAPKDDDGIILTDRPGCSNCGWPTASHCKRHVIPCCPGTCQQLARRLSRSAGESKR